MASLFFARPLPESTLQCPLLSGQDSVPELSLFSVDYRPLSSLGSSP
jgi:hypothetical protein